jgi:hypothetical protein
MPFFEPHKERREFLMDWDPELLAGLALHNRDQTLVEIVPLHHKDIGHALSSVEREGGDLG